MTPAERVQRIVEECSSAWSCYNIGSRDREFLASLAQRKTATLTPKQEKWLADIEEKAFT